MITECGSSSLLIRVGCAWAQFSAHKAGQGLSDHRLTEQDGQSRLLAIKTVKQQKPFLQQQQM